jgi:hypothetical protein
MNVLIKVFAALFAVILLLNGLGWAFFPSNAASFLGMSLMDGLGRSSQIADVGAFFWGAGIMIMFGLKTRNIVWYQASALLLGFAAVLRVLAWAVHGAPFALQQIIIEVLIVVVLMTAASRLTKQT